jgi:AP-4 complex subunit epsilon-1
MSAGLCALHEVVRAEPAKYRNLVPSFTSILKQARPVALPAQ